MSLFDLLFIAVFLTSVVTLIVAAVAAIRGQGARANKILVVWAISAGGYAGIGALSHALLPLRVLNVGDEQCADDWCIAVEKANHAPVAGAISYEVTLRIFSQAQRVAQRENGLMVYLTDAGGNRYDPVPDSSEVPLNIRLEAQQSVMATRVFKVPPDARDLGFVVAHEGGFPIAWFIIGRSPFQKT